MRMSQRSPPLAAKRERAVDACLIDGKATCGDRREPRAPSPAQRGRVGVGASEARIVRVTVSMTASLSRCAPTPTLPRCAGEGARRVSQAIEGKLRKSQEALPDSVTGDALRRSRNYASRLRQSKEMS